MTDTPVESTVVDNSTEATAPVVEATPSTPALKELLSEDLRSIKALQN